MSNSPKRANEPGPTQVRRSRNIGDRRCFGIPAGTSTLGLQGGQEGEHPRRLSRRRGLIPPAVKRSPSRRSGLDPPPAPIRLPSRSFARALATPLQGMSPPPYPVAPLRWQSHRSLRDNARCPGAGRQAPVSERRAGRRGPWRSVPSVPAAPPTGRGDGHSRAGTRAAAASGRTPAPCPDECAVAGRPRTWARPRSVRPRTLQPTPSVPPARNPKAPQTSASGKSNAASAPQATRRAIRDPDHARHGAGRHAARLSSRALAINERAGGRSSHARRPGPSDARRRTHTGSAGRRPA